MKKVLIIANQFPPMGGSGVQRSVKFVKHLRAFGYEPVVLTRETGNMSLKDETLLKDVPEGVKIYRTRPYELPELQGIMKIPGKIAGKFIIPDTAYFWYKNTRKKALDIIKSEGIDIIYTTSAPYSDHLLGLYIKKKLPDIKWAADFRDEWTNNPYTLDNPYNPIRTKIEKSMEHKVVTTADMLITNTGALYGRRKPDNFFKALQELKEEGKIDGSKILVKLIGNYHKDKLQSQIDSFGLSESFEIVGYVPHNVCIQHQMAADVLVLIEGSGRGANAFYTGKVFEYMNTNRPVLAILPEGCAADLVEESKIGIVANTDNVDEIKKNIKEYYDKWCSGTLDFEPDRKIIEGFERKKLTERLAQVFDNMI